MVKTLENKNQKNYTDIDLSKQEQKIKLKETES